jgi:2-phospho-L-lactate guanylyltransferase (CobY/MobA/RfbA family)
MATYVIPYRVGGKTRLGDPKLALAMLSDVTDAVNEIAEEALVVDSPGGQGEAVAAALVVLRGPITIVNADLPCVTSDELEELTNRAPAIGAASDGTTNALSIRDPSEFEPLYGPGSAARFAAHLGAARLALPGLRDDVDTWEDLERVRDRVGENTRRYLKQLERARAS